MAKCQKAIKLSKKVKECIRTNTLKDWHTPYLLKYSHAVQDRLPKARKLSSKIKTLTTQGNAGVTSFSDRHAYFLLKYSHTVQDRLAKALRAEGHEGRLVNPISELTTFSKQYVRGLLPNEYKQDYTVPDKSKLGFESEQTPKRKSRKHTSDKETLDNLYKNTEKTGFTKKRTFLISD